MKKLIFISIFLLSFLNGHALLQDSTQYTILLTGASFASPQNGWFEIGCRKLKARPVNRAIGGESIANTANRMIDGTLYSFEELDNIDALVIMQVHNRNVFDESQLLSKYTDYPVPFDRSNYAAAYDYVIKRYISECYELKNNQESKYYGTKSGKPAVIILCTDWHDGRIIYNTSVRRLASKWGLPLVEFDTSIGFSKGSPHPVTGEQQSLLHAKDTQTIDGVKYGWHPNRGEDKYIQQRMAAIFTDLMKKVLPIK
ncbi:hypothetical protein GGR21_000860 [Dysgonomonas hofstadii]|uniref:DUF5040 domain-containing protein n=1 Tax=Dysgonomonas hofstadii TaxID=637886 RepID=A0A840CTC1_9BACT|nr:DUF5040 domain-containing protein [Dysgonomonas hofstadii]MBB4034973.1 hypothetical protein [Dysgonomonas hofstadii]